MVLDRRASAEVPRPSRSEAIDTIRAVALLGVIVMNTMAVTMVIAADRVMAGADALDMAVAGAAALIFQGKARACFAFLFGLGFGILLSRPCPAGRGFAPFYARRLAALFVFGIVNQAFLFWGDILAHYAVIGAALMLVREWRDRALLWTGGALIVLPPIVLAALPFALGHPLPNLTGAAEKASAYARAALPIYSDGSYLEAVRHNLGRQPHAYLYDTAHRVEYDLSLLGLFMLGYLAARTRLLLDVDRHRPVLNRIVRWCLPVGIVLSGLYLVRPFGIPLGPVVDALAGAAFSGPSILALALVALGAMWFPSGGLRLRRWLAPAGRMALTNYLASGGIATFVTYGYGLGWLDRLDMVRLVLLGASVFVGLALFSHAWLGVFRLGPAEWVWRSISHARLQPLFRPHPGPLPTGAAV